MIWRADMPIFGRSDSVLTRPLCFVRCRVLQTCIEFHDRYFDADLGHGERVLLGQRGGNPVIASAREDGCTDALLFADDVALDRSRCLILAMLKVILSCTIVPPVMSTGSHPLNSKRSSWRSSKARNSVSVIGLRRPTFMLRNLARAAPDVCAARVYPAGAVSRAFCFAMSSSHGPGNRPRFTTSGANTLSWRGHFSRGNS